MISDERLTKGTFPQRDPIVRGREPHLSPFSRPFASVSPGSGFGIWHFLLFSHGSTTESVNASKSLLPVLEYSPLPHLAVMIRRFSRTSGPTFFLYTQDDPFLDQCSAFFWSIVDQVRKVFTPPPTHARSPSHCPRRLILFLGRGDTFPAAALSPTARPYCIRRRGRKKSFTGVTFLFWLF